MKTIKAAKWGYIITSIIFCLTGIFVILYPGISVTLFCCLLGALLVVAGIFKIIGYFSKDLYRLAFQFDLALGILLAVLGLVAILYPKVILSVLYFLIGIIVLTDSLFKIQTAVDARRFGLRKWWLILLSALVSCVLGLLLMINPYHGAKLLMIMTGITLTAEGILNLCVAVYAVKIIKSTQNMRKTPDEFL